MSPSSSGPPCPTTRHGGYLLGSSDHEVQRLIDQAQMFDREAGWLFDELGDLSGLSAIDIGCGPVGVLPSLASRVGPHGHVVGVDNNPAMIAHAERQCAALDLANVSCRVSDAIRLDFPSDSFDLAHLRLVLINVADPAAVLAEMARVTRPGGVVVVEEYDLLSWECHPPHPSWRVLRDMVHQLWISRGFDGHIGRRLPQLLADAGLGEAQVRAHSGFDRSDFWNQRLLIDFARRFTPLLVELDLVTPAELDTLVVSVAEHLDRPDTLVIRPLLVQAWAPSP
jgi:ubiquinone/menaquinone biosynthesis C-methylase UbiE